MSETTPGLPPEAPPPLDEGVSPGIVPPAGALPISYGVRPFLVWALRLAVVAFTIWGAYWAVDAYLHGVGEAFSIVDIIGPALAVGYFIARRLTLLRRHSGEKGDAIVAAGVRVEPAGLLVMSWLWDHRFSWGELVGIADARNGRGGFSLRALRGSKRVEIYLPPGGWGRRLARALTGQTEPEAEAQSGSES